MTCTRRNSGFSLPRSPCFFKPSELARRVGTEQPREGRNLAPGHLLPAAALLGEKIDQRMRRRIMLRPRLLAGFGAHLLGEASADRPQQHGALEERRRRRLPLAEHSAARLPVQHVAVAHELVDEAHVFRSLAG